MTARKIIINSIVATMTIYQLSSQESWPYIVGDPLMGQFQQTVLETLFLSNGTFLLGNFIGSQMALQLKHLFRLFQKQSSKFIFLSSDLINSVGALIYFFLVKDCSVFYYWGNKCYHSKTQKNSIYLITRIINAIAQGMNFAQAIIYLKQLTYKAGKGQLFLLIPLQLLIGLTLTISLTVQHFQFTLEFNGLITTLRMIFLIILDFETPNYYFFVKKNIKATKQTLSKIHGNSEIETQIITQYYQQVENTSSVLFLSKMIKKYLICIVLLIINELTGFQVTNQMSLLAMYSPNFITGVGALIIFILLFLGKKIKKANQILIGQIWVCLGLAIICFTDIDLSFGYSLLTIGYCVGLGTIIFQIIPIMLSEAEIFQCITVLWIVRLAQLIFLAIFYNKSIRNDVQIFCYYYCNYCGNLQLLCQPVVQSYLKIYFYFSCFGLFFLLFFLRVIIRIIQNRNKVQQKEEKCETDVVDTKIELAENLMY